MKTRKKLLLALLSVTCVTAGALGLAACGDKNPNTADTRNPDIVAVYTKYVAYAESNNETVLTYEQWLDSIKGAPGAAGADGATWLSGAENPAASAGKTGDFYLNTATFDVFKKGADGWGAAICNIKGEDGGSASKGDDGATWLTGAETPAADAGKVGDLYLNTATSDVYQKTADGWGTPICNIKGATGGAGSAGSEGNGIADITLNADNKLEITFTKPLDSEDSTSNKVIIDLPEAFFHTHTYAETKYDKLLFAPGATTSGLAYKVCTGTVDGNACEHIELVALPELGDGSEAHPYLLNYEIDDTERNVYQKLLPESGTTYFEFTPEKDGYFYVTTPTTVDTWYGDYYYACNFNVKNGTARYTQKDSQSFIAAYCTVKAGQTVTIDATRSSQYDGFEGPDEQRYVEFTYYTAEETQEYSVTVIDPDGAPVSGASVKAYTKDGNKYTEVANVSAVTTGTDGVAKFNLLVGHYYFAVTPKEADDYQEITADSGKVHINLHPNNFTVTAKLEAAQSGGNTEFTLEGKDFATFDLKAGVTYTFNIKEGDSSGYAFELSAGSFTSATISMDGEQAEDIASAVGAGFFQTTGYGMVATITLSVSSDCTLYVGSY